MYSNHNSFIPSLYSYLIFSYLKRREVSDHKNFFLELKSKDTEK